jgi:hypothetical protein
VKARTPEPRSITPEQAVDRLRAALLEVEAPADQLERIGLA